MRIVFEKQDQNQVAIQIQRQADMEFNELKNRNNHLFNRTLKTWHGDREISNFFMNNLQESEHIERKLIFQLENQKILLKEKRDLIDLETNLIYKQQQLKREDKA
ncbi:DUF3958 family protein [Bacillus cereus]|nr:DUF3958 family protein [Bacillus cereus]